MRTLAIAIAVALAASRAAPQPAALATPSPSKPKCTCCAAKAVNGSASGPTRRASRPPRHRWRKRWDAPVDHRSRCRASPFHQERRHPRGCRLAGNARPDISPPRRGSDPLLHAFVQDKLVRMVARYRASAEHPTTSFDDAAGTLVFTMREPRSGGWFAGGYDIERTLEEAYARHLAAHFEKTGPAVADGELEAYFRHLTTAQGDRVEERTRRGPRRAPARACSIFETRVRGKAIHDEVEKYLVDEAPWLARRGQPRRRRAPAFAQPTRVSSTNAFSPWRASFVARSTSGSFARRNVRASGARACPKSTAFASRSPSSNERRRATRESSTPSIKRSAFTKRKRARSSATGAARTSTVF